MKIPVGPYQDSTNINVTYTNKAAHINNDSALLTALSKHGAYAVAGAVKIYYQKIYRKDLNVTRTSMAIEIIGHLYPDQVSRAILNSSIVPQKRKDIAASIIRRTSVIDIGESSVDPNRWFWDALAIPPTIVTIIFNIA